MEAATPSGGWRNWCGLEVARPAQVLTPSSVSEVVDSVVVAGKHGMRAKMVGSGHSFTGIAVTDGLLLRPERLTGIASVDRDAMTVTVLAGTPLHVLNEQLRGLGLALHNMGDVDRQTVAGAIATGTHGTGGRWTSLSAQVAGLQLVTADGEVRQASAEKDPDLFDAARVGLGALGVVTAVTLLVEPALLLEAVERPMGRAEAVDGFEEHRVRVGEPARQPGAEVHPGGQPGGHPSPDGPQLHRRLGPGLHLAATRPVPGDGVRAAPGTRDGCAGRGPSPGRAVRVADRLPGRGALRARRRRLVVDRSRARVGVPRVPRQCPDRPHVVLPRRRAAAEGVRRAPPLGQAHTRTAADLAPAYPHWADFQRLRDELDPGRMFANAYLDRVLGC